MEMIVCPSCKRWPVGEKRGAIVVWTPLDAITQLETQPIAAVVLSGQFAADREFVEFLAESYPQLRIEQQP
ncbi:MAG: hypothetical protein ABI591_14755 [Kofleriaceae bacterium]